MIERLFYLLALHALTDYVWQPELMANRKSPTFPQYGHDPYGPWWWWMTAHSLINGLGVAMVCGWELGLAETVVHGLTDYVKCRGWATTLQDQGVHLGSKLLWAWLT